MEKDDRYNDFLLDEDGDDLVQDGDFAVGDGRLDDGVIISKLNSGQLKSSPMLGPNLALMLNGKVTATDMRQLIDLHLRMDAKDAKKIEVDRNGNFQVKL